MKRRRRSSKTVEGKQKKLQGKSKRKSCARKHRKKRNCVGPRRNKRQRGLKSAKNGSEIKFFNERPRKERGRNAKDRIRLSSNGFAKSENADRKSKQN